MKHGKNPTLKQKKILKELHLVVDNWLVAQDTPKELHIINRTSGRVRKFNKEAWRLLNG